MNKKILLSGGIIAFVAAVALGATYAAWQAQAVIESNTVTTAQLAITAQGVQGGAESTYAKPVFEEGVLPGFINFQEDNGDQIARGIITNDSSIPLDLYMYFKNVSGAACAATKVAWQSSEPNSVNVLGGYAIGNEPDEAGEIADPANPDAGELALVSAYAGPANAVKIADADYFVKGAEVAVRQIVAFATDAPNNLQGKNCIWKEVFVGTLPDQLPEVE